MSNRTAAATVAFLAALVAAALTGCTAPAPEGTETSAAVQPVVKPTPSGTPVPTPTATAEVSRCDVLSKISLTGYSEGDEEPTYYLSLIHI